jgi:hypothetical protein
MPTPTFSEPPTDELPELKHRIAQFARRIDLAGEVAAHPWRAVGLAALAGAAIALSRRRERGEPVALRDRFVDAALAGLGTLVLRQVRDTAWRHVAGAAQRWWGEAGVMPNATVTPNAAVKPNVVH